MTLAERASALRQTDAFLLVDANGGLLASSRFFPPPPRDLSDRSYFLDARDNESGRAIGPPVLNRGTNTWAFHFAKRIESVDGTFLGVAVAVLELAYYEQLYGSLALGPGSNISLFRSDAILLARFPGIGDAIGREFSGSPQFRTAVANSDGTPFRVVSLVDGQDRLISSRSLANFPLRVHVGVAVDAVLAGWRVVALNMAVGALLLASVVGGAVFLAKRAARAEAVAATAVLQRERELATAQLTHQRDLASERIANERKLLEQYTDFRVVVESMSPAVWRFGPDDRLALTNGRDTKVLGLPPGSARAGQTPDDIAAAASAAGADRAAAAIGRLAMLAAARETASFVQDLGNGRAALAALRLLPDGGWLTTFEDVSEQRQAEQLRLRQAEELEHMISGMPGALMRVGPNPDGIVTALYSSPSILAITGYRPEEIKPGFMDAHMSAEDRQRLHATDAEARARGHASLEFHFRHRDGKLRLIASQLNGRPGQDGEIIMSWHDITKERQLADQLAQSAKLAQLGEAATGMAHELNQPLAGISLAAENALRSLARTPDAPPRALEKLELIIAMAQRASDTIDHMRVFGRTGSGPSGPVALADVLSGGEHLVQAKLRHGGVRLVSRLPADLPAVLGKRIPLEQVLINLISNACDAYAGMDEPPAAEQRSVVICGSAEAGRVSLVVQDHAGGIPAEILPRIFEPFFTTKEVGQGTGLGLSISYGIITDMGGTIGAELADGGTRFTIELPAAPVD
jgi:signal transduction histidine kinase